MNPPPAIKSSVSGFTLIELMIAVAIISILATIAIPSYNDYMVRSKIPDATSTLANKRVELEQFFQDNRTYIGTTACANAPASKYFDFSCSVAPTAVVYTVQALGKGSMAGFTYTIDQDNTRTSDIAAGDWNTNGVVQCWITSKGGTC
jgi:type IV pilus assembly protein PilE